MAYGRATSSCNFEAVINSVVIRNSDGEGDASALCIGLLLYLYTAPLKQGSKLLMFQHFPGNYGIYK